MIEDFWSKMDTNQKVEIAKYAAVFAGGVLVGYSINKLLNSYDFGTLKENVSEAVNNYSDSEKEKVDLDEIIEEYKE